MPATPKDEDAARMMKEHERRNDLLGQRVLRALGQPGDLLCVQVRQLWEGHYRVNILVGADVASTRVAHSYFLVTDGDDNIVATTPTVTRRY
jgi:hypothetical protein